MQPWAASPRRLRALKMMNLCLLVLESIVVVRTWIESVPTYLVLPLYMQGNERMPYQGRFLMMYPMRWADHSRWIRRLCGHFGTHNMRNPLYMGIFLASVPALLIALYSVTLIYRRFSTTGRLAWLVPWVCLYAVQNTYIVRYNQSFLYPYDFASLAFFAAGLFFIVDRKFFLFCLVFLTGTLNRETMLLLLPVLFVELSVAAPEKNHGWRRVQPFAVAGLLAVGWFAIRLLIRRHFHSLQSEENSHMYLNFLFLRHIQDWPELASTGGFLWLVPLVFWSRIPHGRLRWYFLALVPAWFLIMSVYGMIAEARIFGELLVLLVPIAMIVFEEWLTSLPSQRAGVPT